MQQDTLRRSSVVQDDIVKIHDEELIGDDAVRNIVVVDVETGEAVQRSYAVIPSTEGDNINVYTYSCNFKTKGELIQGTATSSDDWQTCTFTETTQVAGEASEDNSDGDSEEQTNEEEPQ